MSPQSTTVEQKIERIASRSHGVVTWAEMRAAGVRGHRAPSVEAVYLAAVKACGEGARLSGRAAAYLWGLIKGDVPPPEVTSPRKHGVKGVRTHRGPARQHHAARHPDHHGRADARGPRRP